MSEKAGGEVCVVPPGEPLGDTSFHVPVGGEVSVPVARAAEKLMTTMNFALASERVKLTTCCAELVKSATLPNSQLPARTLRGLRAGLVAAG